MRRTNWLQALSKCFTRASHHWSARQTLPTHSPISIKNRSPAQGSLDDLTRGQINKVLGNLAALGDADLMHRVHWLHQCTRVPAPRIDDPFIGYRFACEGATMAGSRP